MQMCNTQLRGGRRPKQAGKNFMFKFFFSIKYRFYFFTTYLSSSSTYISQNAEASLDHSHLTLQFNCSLNSNSGYQRCRVNTSKMTLQLQAYY